MTRADMPGSSGRTPSILDRIVDWAKRSSFLRLLVVITLVAEVLTTALNVINRHVWWGENPWKLYVVGVVDAFFVSIIALPFIIIIIMRLKQADRESAGMSAYLDNILRTSTDMAIAATDAEFRITLFNPAAEEIFGYRAEDVIGRDVRNLYERDGMDPDRLAAAKEAIKRDGEFSFSLKHQTTGHEGPRYMDIRISGITDKAGGLAGYVLMARDVTEMRKALGMLAESEERFRSLVESSTDWVWEMDAHSRYTYSSPRVKDILGFRPDEVIGKTPYDLMMPVEARRTKSVFGVYVSIGKPCMAIESTNVHKDGRLIVLETSGVPIYDQRGEPCGYRGISRDVTGRRRFETALKESEAKFRLLSEESLVGVYIVQDERFVYVNPRFSEIVGYTRDEIIGGMKLDDIIMPESMDLVRDNISKRLSGELESAHYHLKGRRKDGGQIDAEVLGSSTSYNGKPAIIGTLIDVTERKKTEDALKESEAKFRTLVEHSIIGVAIIQDGRYAYVNPRHAQMLGYTQDEMTSLESVLDIVHPDDVELVRENIRKRATGEVRDIRYRFRFLKKDGETVHVEAHGSTAEYNGRPAVIGSVLDITEQIRSGNALRESEERYRCLVQQAADALFIHDMQGRIREVNNQACSMLGYTRDELLALSIQELDSIIPPRSLENLWKTMKPGEPMTAESVARKKDGGLLPVEIRVVVVESGGDWLVQALVRDITERKKTEEEILKLNQGLERMVEERTAELLEREHSYRTLAENLPGIVYRVFLREGNRMQCFNQMQERLTGYTMDELQPGRCCSIDPLIFTEDRERVVDLIRGAVADDKPFLVEYRLMHKNGSIRHMQERGRPVTGPDGRPLYIDGVILDITELKKAQEEKDAMQARLSESQKLEAIGNLAGGIAHDFSSLLTVIQGDCDMLKDVVREEQPGFEYLAQINRAAESATELTRKLLIFSRRKKLERTPLDINGTVIEMVGMLKRLIGKGITIDTELDDSAWNIFADSSGIEQVVMNLALNARDAMPEGGTITISTGRLELDEEFCRLRENVKPGRYVRLSVTDTGTGMDEDTKARIFEPFFSRKSKGKGTGLGLSVVYGIVSEHGGWIDVSSSPGQGSRFDVYLEAVDKTAA